MRKIIAFSVAFSLILATWGAHTSASPAAQSNAPAITSFTSTATTVNRNALAERTARIPVSWISVNRPLVANLFFEQVLPDGSAVNVELPRAIPWVNSSGDGMAAPILPEGNLSEITLRVRLVNLLTGQVYSERQLTFNITTGGGSGNGNSNRPAITRFTTSLGSVRGDQLANSTARVPVSWTAVNRPVTSNLIFEQILSDGSAVNVELPRENPWVNSVGDGVAAPVAPGGNATSIRLRVRLIDLLSGRVFDQREFTLAIDNTPPGQPNIRTFTTSFTSVDANELAARTARVPVTWAVDNRPANSNLIFEQVLPGGSVINVELPRTVPIVPSAGNGIAAPILPSGAAEILLRVRLVNLRDNATVAQREITLPIRGVAVVPTATAAPTSGIQIRSFAISPNPVARGGQVTFTWDVTGATTLSITRLSERGQIFLEAITGNLAASGSQTYTLPADYINRAEFVLLTNDSQVNQYITVNITCPFSTSFISGDCPITQQSVTAAYQSFEGGHMVWNGSTREIFVLYADGTYQTAQDTWTEGEVFDDGRTPPEGRFAPARGFGKVWFNDANIRQRLGWATAQEQSYNTTWETHKFNRGRSELTSNVLRFPDARLAIVEDRWRIG